MTRPVKDLGMVELAQLKRRVIRQYAAKRLGKADHDFIVDHLDEVEARIASMHELDESGKEC